MDEPLQSGVLPSPAEEMLRQAIATTLAAEPAARADTFARLLRELEEFMRSHPELRPWKHSVHTGTDGSRVFRGGTGRSIVVDPAGTMWRARSYEDFETAYEIANGQCTISALTPLYGEMVRLGG